MTQKYNCNICNFHTHHKGNFMKHNTTKKHINLIEAIGKNNSNNIEKNKNVIEKNDIVIEKNDNVIEKNYTKKKKNDKKVCNYCNKIYSCKNSLREHTKICKDKVKQGEIQKILDDKNKLEKKYKKNKKKLKEIEIENKEIKIENEELEKEYNDFLKKAANNFVDKSNKITNITNNHNNHNNNTLNMHYVINNFTDAPNFEDQITEQLTDSQKESIIKSGPLTGCVKLINMKCIEDKKANERSIHCLDPSRRKFIIRIDDNWQVDLKGKKMLTISIPITKDIFEKDFDFDNINDPFMKSNIINKLIQLEHKAGHVKITNDLTGTTLLKNNN